MLGRERFFRKVAAEGWPESDARKKMRSGDLKTNEEMVRKQREEKGVSDAQKREILQKKSSGSLARIRR